MKKETLFALEWNASAVDGLRPITHQFIPSFAAQRKK